MKLFICLIVVAALAYCKALSCPKCDREKCNNDLTKCSVGLTGDICGCCQVCAKALGEECGGIWNHGGSCGNGLECQPNRQQEQNPGKCIRARKGRK